LSSSVSDRCQNAGEDTTQLRFFAVDSDMIGVGKVQQPQQQQQQQ